MRAGGVCLLIMKKNLPSLQTVKRSLSYSNASWAELISKLQIIGSRVYVILHPPCQDGLAEYREEKATKKRRNKGNKPRFLPLWLAARWQRGSCMDVESCSNLVAEAGTAITIKTLAYRIPPPQSGLPVRLPVFYQFCNFWQQLCLYLFTLTLPNENKVWAMCFLNFSYQPPLSSIK